jgi:hypothetical protein
VISATQGFTILLFGTNALTAMTTRMLCNALSASKRTNACSAMWGIDQARLELQMRGDVCHAMILNVQTVISRLVFVSSAKTDFSSKMAPASHAKEYVSSALVFNNAHNVTKSMQFLEKMAFANAKTN